MYRKLVLCLCVLLFSATLAIAQDVSESEQPEAQGVKEDTKTEAQDVSEDKTPEAQETKKDGNPEAEEAKKGNPSGTKELSGMSIVGNDEAPKALYIVPWKSSEIGAETNLDMMLNERDVPVDRDVFKRQLEFYKVSTEK